MPKREKSTPAKIGITNALMCDKPFMQWRNPKQKELFNYGIETGIKGLQYNDTKDAALLQEIVDRCVYERDEWLKLAPTGDEEF